MKYVLAVLLSLLLCAPALADQQTTVLDEHASMGKITATLPYIDGNTEEMMEKQANSLIRNEARELAKALGGSGSISYEIVLNRPSLVGILLKASGSGQVLYRGLNIDLTSGREFTVNDFFIDNDAVRAELGEYGGLLFTEDGIRTRGNNAGPYTNLLPYAKFLPSIRIGEAGRLFQVARLTQNAADKTLRLKPGSLVALKLAANPSTGNRWEINLDADAQGKVQKAGSSFMMPQLNDKRTGMPGEEVIVLAVLEPGSMKVTMDYKRPWERKPLDSFTFTLDVKE